MTKSARTLSFTAITLLAVSTLALRQDKPAVGGGDMQLPPGWTPEDMQKMVAAMTPGKEQAWLASLEGTWEGKCTMWMGPDTQPVTVPCKQTMKPLFDGRYIEGKMEGEMPGMGPYKGLAILGFDNVSKTFNGSWLDSMSTGIMFGTGTMDADKTLNWTYQMNCPLTGKPQPMKQIEKHPDNNTMTLEMWTADPKSGKEFKTMFIELKRK